MILIDPYLLIIIIFSCTIGMAIIIATQKIQFLGNETDNEIMLRVASQWSTWKWPSKMYKVAYKSLTKNATILLLAVVQKILRKKISDHVYVTLNCFASAVTTVLVYLIGKNYFGAEIGFFLSMLYMTSFWIWQMSIYVGHTIVATIFFLLAVFFIQKTSLSLYPWIVLSGIAFGFAMFSSPSSRKYIIPYLASIFYSKYQLALAGGLTMGFLKKIFTQYGTFSMALNIILPLCILAAIIAMKLGYKKIVSDMYNQKSLSLLNELIVSRDKFSLEHYQKHANTKINQLVRKYLSILMLTILTINFIRYDYLLPLLAGFFITIGIFTFPDIKGSIKGYFHYYNHALFKNRLRIYPIYFARANKTLPFFPCKRASWDWVIKIFLIMAPVQTITFLFSALFLLTINMTAQTSFGQWLTLISLFFVSLSSIAWGEFTQCPQISRTYMPGFLTALIFLGYSLQALLSQYEYFWLLVYLMIIVSFVHAAIKYIFKIYPSRMTATHLIKKMDELGIKEFYTYHNAYNNALILSINPEDKKKYKINFINSIAEINDGWIVIPGTNLKSVSMESEFEELFNGDFSKDPILNKLLETRGIEKIAECKFQALGTSDIWVHEAEITSYRDIILHDISPKDRFRGYVWLLHSSKIPLKSL